MTLEKAIKLLKQYQGYEPMFPDGETLKHAFDLTDETVDTLLAALRPVSREQVEKVFSGCDFCKIELDDYPYIVAHSDYSSSDTMFYDRKHKGWSLDQIATTPKIPAGGYRSKGVRVYHG